MDLLLFLFGLLLGHEGRISRIENFIEQLKKN